MAAVTCPGGKSSCPAGTTCCLLTGGDYGCCPYPEVSIARFISVINIECILHTVPVLSSSRAGVLTGHLWSICGNDMNTFILFPTYYTTKKAKQGTVNSLCDMVIITKAIKQQLQIIGSNPTRHI